MSPRNQIVLCSVVALAAGLVGVVSTPVRGWAILVASSTAVIAILCSLRAISLRLWAIHTLGNNPVTVAQISAELHSMHVILNRYPECNIPTTEWSMRFCNLHTILDILDRKTPRNIIEFGSGISTLLVAAWLRERQFGSILSFDHDENWAHITRSYLERAALDEFAQVVSTSLVPTRAFGHTLMWYDIGESLDDFRNIDLVIVDGPPAGEGRIRLSRLPALERLYDRLSPACTVLLDDAGRPGESEVAELWTSTFRDFVHQIRKSATGMAVLELMPAAHARVVGTGGPVKAI